MMLTSKKNFYSDKILSGRSANTVERLKSFELAVVEALHNKDGKLLIDIATKFAEDQYGHRDTRKEKESTKKGTKKEIKQVTEPVSGVDESNNEEGEKSNI